MTSRLAPLLLVVLLGAGALALAYRQAKQRQAQPPREQRRSLLDYLLIWPLLFESSSADRSNRVLTKRELIGWLIVGALMLFGVIFIHGRS